MTCSDEWTTWVLMSTLEYYQHSDRLLSLHHSASWLTILLYADLSLLLIRSTTVVSSANLIKHFIQYFVGQLSVSSVNRSGPDTREFTATWAFKFWKFKPRNNSCPSSHSRAMTFLFASGEGAS